MALNTSAQAKPGYTLLQGAQLVGKALPFAGLSDNSQVARFARFVSSCAQEHILT